MESERRSPREEHHKILLQYRKVEYSFYFRYFLRRNGEEGDLNGWDPGGKNIYLKKFM